LEVILIVWLLVQINWDYERFTESGVEMRMGGKYYEVVNLGSVSKPMTIVDKHGKMILWYLPGLLLPYRVVCSTAFV
jgi:hypothetical protein